MSVCGRNGRPGCGKEILWGVDEHGTRIPLDPRAPVYHVSAFDPVTKTYAIERAGGDRPVNYVTHFATCPYAKEFSGRGRSDRPDPRARAAGD